MATTGITHAPHEIISKQLLALALVLCHRDRILTDGAILAGSAGAVLRVIIRHRLIVVQPRAGVIIIVPRASRLISRSLGGYGGHVHW